RQDPGTGLRQPERVRVVRGERRQRREERRVDEHDRADENEQAPHAGDATYDPPVAAPQLLLDLLRARGPAGREDEAARVWRDAAAAFAEVTTDSLGSSVARVGRGDSRLLAIVGHSGQLRLGVAH